MTALAQLHDALLLDLDGTVYLGGQVIPHVVDVLIQAAARGARPVFITNNASRPPAEVAAALNGMGVAAVESDVLTSPQAAAAMLAGTHSPGSAVLIVGAKALSDAVADVGLIPVRLASENPVAVVQGHSPDTGWRDLAEACIALRIGVDWVASNTDTTLPTDRGLLPGNGAMVQALVAATGRTPRVAGKPNRPLLDEAVSRFASERPLVVGDRLDTDIEAAMLAGLPSLLVFTGVANATDLLAAPASRRPTYISFDLRGLVDVDLVAEIATGHPGWCVQDGEHQLVLTSAGSPGSSDDGGALRALAALAARSWATGVRQVRAGDEPATAVLARFGLASVAAVDGATR